MRRRVGIGTAVAAFALLFVAACGGDDDDEGAAAESDSGSGDGTEETATSEETTTTLSPDEEVLAAYQAANDALMAAFDPPDPNNPGLLASWGGEALERVQSTLTQLQGGTESFVATTVTHATITSLVGNSATLEDCFVNTEQLIDRATRQPLSEPSEDVNHVEVEMERVDGTWKVMRSLELTEPCTPG